MSVVAMSHATATWCSPRFNAHAMAGGALTPELRARMTRALMGEVRGSIRRVTRWIQRFTRTAACAWLAAPFIACGGEATTPASAASRAAATWRDKCGACHVPVEPGSRDRGTIEAALAKHRRRVRLSEPEWSELVDFLAPSPSQPRLGPHPNEPGR